MMQLSSRITELAFCKFGTLCVGLCVHAQQAPRQSEAHSRRGPACKWPAPTPNDTLKSVEVDSGSSCPVSHLGAERH